MNIKISHPTKFLFGKVELPASKSVSNRLLIIQRLCDQSFEILNLSEANDTQILKQILGEDKNVVDAEDAGTTFRFLTAYYALTEGEKILTGSDQMKKRPIGVLVDALRELGADISYLGEPGYPPIAIRGSKLKGGEITIDGSISSQYISALLLIAPRLSIGLSLHLKGKVASTPYIKMTLKLMNKLGISYLWKGNVITIPSQPYKPLTVIVEPDWSAASYFFSFAAMASSSELTLMGLNKESIQGDRIVASLFEQFGVKVSYLKKGIKLRKEIVDNPLMQFDTDFNDYPDMVQSFIPIVATSGLPAVFSGVKSLRIKETNRVEALQIEMKKFGIEIIELDEDRIELKEQTVLDSTEAIETHNDHRMAMSLASMALKQDYIIINNAEVVNKSFPTFWENLDRIGFKIEEV
jgi:3-phosphoshikimate 1-carboxyvinyltransferase